MPRARTPCTVVRSSGQSTPIVLDASPVRTAVSKRSPRARLVRLPLVILSRDYAPLSPNRTFFPLAVDPHRPESDLCGSVPKEVAR